MSELREQLAAIEHQRWADWQRYMHDQCEPGPDGTLIIPKDKVERWVRQVETVYADLPEEEKDSDRQQVDRVWHIIEGIRANYRDEAERARQTQHAFAQQLQAASRERDRIQRRSVVADDALARLAQWLQENLVVDQEARLRLSNVQPDYVVSRALGILEHVREGVKVMWPMLLDRLQPMLLAAISEIAKEVDDAVVAPGDRPAQV